MNSSHPHLSRLRQNSSLREVLATVSLRAQDLIWPLFIKSGSRLKNEIANMPQQYCLSVDMLVEHLQRPIANGLRSVLLFAVSDPEHRSLSRATSKDYDFSTALEAQLRAVELLKKTYPELLVFTDLCICALSSTAHCALLDEYGQVLVEETLKSYAQIAELQIRAGSDAIAPSGMMDGQVAHLRALIDELPQQSMRNTLIISYSSKFSSGLYGPFRETMGSEPKFGDRQAYQLPIDNADIALLESMQDDLEGADMLMVKPAQTYLDILTKLTRHSQLPIVAYQVSATYSMYQLAAQRGILNLSEIMRESLTCIKRAGASLIITYFTPDYLDLLRSQH